MQFIKGREKSSAFSIIFIRIALLITETSKRAALSIPKDTALQLKDDALEYYKKAGSYKGLIMQEDGTGTYCYDEYSYNFLTEDGYFYIPECGRVCASFGNIFTFGIKDGSRLWRVFYRLSPEEAASLPEPTYEAFQCTDISKIRLKHRILWELHRN